jgi:NitT/TauT family transport system substrate-binding protein
VTVQPHPFGKPALDAMLAGKADLATAADTPIVLAILNGKPVSIVATIESASRNTVVVARKESGISRPEDLAGKRVGRPAGTNAEFFLDTLLMRHAIEAGAIQPVDLKPDEMSDALAAGRVDAVAVWNPYALQIERRLAGAVVDLVADDLYTETMEIVGRPDLVKDRAPAVEKFVRGLLRAETFVREHPEEARDRVASALGIDAADVVAVWAPFKFRVSLNQGLLVLLDDEARWAIRSGLAPKQATPNFLDSMALQPLENANPDAVRLVR